MSAQGKSSGSREEIKRLLALYRKGRISENLLLEQLEDLQRDGNGSGGQFETDTVGLIDRLDAYRAAEASGAATVGRWSDLTDDGALAGGLRTVAAREAWHAELLERRIRELGGSPKATIPEWLASYNAAITDPKASDLERLSSIVAQFPDVEASVEPLKALASSLGEDSLTRELLLAICTDEVSSLRWIHRACAARRKDKRAASRSSIAKSST